MVILPGQTRSIDDGQGLRVVVLEGAIWLTQENDPDDRRVKAGGSATLDRPGRAVLQAGRSGPARVSVEALEPLGQGPRGVEAVERRPHGVAQLRQALLRQRMGLEEQGEVRVLRIAARHLP
jgi:hypothetical protein